MEVFVRNAKSNTALLVMMTSQNVQNVLIIMELSLKLNANFVQTLILYANTVGRIIIHAINA